MTLRNLLTEYSVSSDEIASAEQLLLELSDCGLPRAMKSSAILLGKLQRQIATCEAHNDCIELMLKLVPAEILDSPPSTKHMVNLTKIAIAKQLLQSTMQSMG